MNANAATTITTGQRDQAAKRQPPKKVNKSDIQPRKMDFQFDPSMPRYWFDNDQFKTMLLTALSCTFPEGERFFVRSVRHFQKNLTDPLLREQVKGFIGQEAHHGNEHDAFNHFMESKGVPTGKVDAYVKDGLKFMAKWLSPERQLAKTCALEHFTAMLAEMILEHPEFIEGMDERMVPLWLWHAVEESEHKAVAFDVYQDQVDSYWVRTSEMALTTVEFIGFTILHYNQLRAEMDDPTDWKSVRQGLNWLVGKPGWLRKLGKSYLAYYKRDFHPSKRDSAHLRQQGLEKLARLMKRPQLLS
ncbi:metal-dependent hydrolase [Alcanivorax sp.]|uniref:metal-dependent hydrolase n=1 Tax=Alcanivorax sp. TaxID=1872427 RepID=UPI002B2685B4|nr:metal-dependent hydrolase [Alcanivorax sp.]